MAWPYKFLTLTSEEVQARRETLDRYAIYAQLTTLLPALILAVTRLTLRRLCRSSNPGGRGSYDAVPHSPSLKSRRHTVAGGLEQKVRLISWWLDNEVVLFGWRAGTREQWLVGLATGLWLMTLCVMETGDGT